MSVSVGSGKSWIDLAGQIALVTGAASGIGRAAALALASAGAIIVATDLDAEAAQATAATIAERGGEARGCALDVTSERDWSEVAAWIKQRWSRLDILVNSAGVALSDRVGDAALDTYHRTFAINVEGSLLGMTTALRFMREVGKGVILNVSSTAALKGNPIMASYGASKAAIAHFTRSAALENIRAGHDIRINSIHPGLIDTPMSEDFYRIFSKVGPPEAVVAMTTTGRAGRPDEVGDLILYLASERASFISGAAIVIDRAASA
jgi:NAD(P)-dependent dehydrogenase (short-subunit alcohol dehydrogenase family)